MVQHNKKVLQLHFTPTATGLHLPCGTEISITPCNCTVAGPPWLGPGMLRHLLLRSLSVLSREELARVTACTFGVPLDGQTPAELIEQCMAVFDGDIAVSMV